MCLHGGNWRTGQLNSSDAPDAPHAASEIHPGLSAVLFLRPGIQPDQVLIEEILVAVETSSSCGRCVNSLAVVKLLSYQEAFPEVIPAPSSCPQQTGLCWPLCWCSRSSWCSHFFSGGIRTVLGLSKKLLFSYSVHWTFGSKFQKFLLKTACAQGVGWAHF